MSDLFLVASKITLEDGALKVTTTDAHETWGDWLADESLIAGVGMMAGMGGECVILTYYCEPIVTEYFSQKDVENAIGSKLNRDIRRDGYISGFEPNEEFFDSLDM